MRHFAAKLSLALLTLTLVTACVKHDEIDFEGSLVYIQPCSLNHVRPVAGYLVELDKPQDVGRDINFQGKEYKNAVMLFDPDRILQEGDRLRGTFYFDDDASRMYCDFNNLNDIDIPQGIFLSVSVD